MPESRGWYIKYPHSDTPVDKAFFDRDMTAAEVHRSLVLHDYWPSSIELINEETKEIYRPYGERSI